MAETLTNTQIVAASEILDRDTCLPISGVPQLLLNLPVPSGCEVAFVRIQAETEVLALVASTRRANQELLRLYCRELSLYGAVPVYVYGIVPPKNSR